MNKLPVVREIPCETCEGKGGVCAGGQIIGTYICKDCGGVGKVVRLIEDD